MGKVALRIKLENMRNALLEELSELVACRETIEADEDRIQGKLDLINELLSDGDDSDEGESGEGSEEPPPPKVTPKKNPVIADERPPMMGVSRMTRREIILHILAANSTSSFDARHIVDEAMSSGLVTKRSLAGASDFIDSFRSTLCAMKNKKPVEFSFNKGKDGRIRYRHKGES